MKKILILNTCLLLGCLNIHAQYVITKLWDKTIGGNLEENDASLLGGGTGYQRCYVLPDGKILIAGSSNSQFGGDKTQNTWGNLDAWLVALDSSTGQIAWDRDYGGLQHDLFADLSNAGNGNHLLTFSSESDSPASGNFTAPYLYHPASNNTTIIRYLLLDNNWNVVWDRIFAGNCSFVSSRTIWQNGKYYLLFWGNNISQSDLMDTACFFNLADNKIIMVAHDSSGNWLWDKNYGADGPGGALAYDRSRDLLPLGGGGFLMSGVTDAHLPVCTITDTSAGLHDINIYRLDTAGQVLWQRCYGGGGEERINSKLVKTTDGNYLFSGVSSSPQGGEVSQPNPATTIGSSLWIVKFNASGAILWDKRYSACHGAGGVVYPAINTSDGGFLMGATIVYDSIPGCDVTEYGSASKDYWVIKLDSAGNKQWDKRWGGNGTDILYDLAQLADDSYIATGISYSDSSGDKTEHNRDASLTTADYWVVHFRADKVEGINELAASLGQLSIMPNPANNICTITCAVNNATLTLYDITGRALLQQTFNSQTTIDISTLTSGVYMVEVKDKEGRSAKGKVVKE